MPRKSNRTKETTDILIAGAGIAGLTLGLILAGTELKVHIIDPHRPKPLAKTEISARTVALMNSSVNILKSTGVWKKIEPLTAPLETMAIIDHSIANLAPVISDFDAPTIGEQQYGFNIPNDPLRAALYELASKNKNITLHVPDSLSGFDVVNGGISATLESGAKITARLMVGADGRNSRVRELSNINTWHKQYKQSAITCLINHSKSHQNTAYEFHRAGGPLALVPLPGNQSSVVWVEPSNIAQNIMAMSANDFIARLQENIGDSLGGITLESGPQCWPLSSLRAKSLTAPRTALIAEAAHAMSPITAQGLNLSLRDVAALAEEIADALRLGLDIGAQNILENYEKRRSLDIRTRIAGVDGMNSIVSTDIFGLKQMRRLGLMAVDKIAPLKAFAMKQGLAPPIDKGRLARGEAL